MIHKFKLLIPFFALLITISCSSQKAAQETATVKEVVKNSDVQEERLPNALLWKIDGNQLSKPSYLFGTIHMIPQEDFFYPAGTTEALASAQSVQFEIDMDDMSDMGKMMMMIPKFMMTNGTSLKDLLNDDDYAMVKSHFENTGLPFFMLEKIKPMFLSILADEDMGAGGFGGMGGNGMEDTGIKSYEMELYSIAQEYEIEVGGLETMEFQMSMMDSIPYDVQAQGLVEAIKNSGGDEKSFDKIVELYKSQDVDAMYQTDEFEGEDGEKFEELFLTKRNKNWIPLMKKAMDKEVTFFAVGAGHLGGPNGVIRLLRKAGYEVTPILTSEGFVKKKKTSRI